LLSPDPAHYAAPKSRSEFPKAFFKCDVLRHELGQDVGLGLHLLLQELNPLLFLLRLAVRRSVDWKAAAPFSRTLLASDRIPSSQFFARIGNRTLV